MDHSGYWIYDREKLCDDEELERWSLFSAELGGNTFDGLVSPPLSLYAIRENGIIKIYKHKNVLITPERYVQFMDCVRLLFSKSDEEGIMLIELSDTALCAEMGIDVAISPDKD
jgi:hypothetical protein